MLRYYNVDVVFSEVPDEVTLAVNITGCPNRCPGCHSPLMQEDVGGILDYGSLSLLMDRYASGVTCVCFMGGDSDPDTVFSLAASVRERYPRMKTAWYSGCSRDKDDAVFSAKVRKCLDYIKLGPYIRELGPLTSPDTNQRFYRVEEDGKFTDMTYKFQLNGRN